MSNNDYILDLLNITDKNIYILNNFIENKVIKGKMAFMIVDNKKENIFDILDKNSHNSFIQ